MGKLYKLYKLYRGSGGLLDAAAPPFYVVLRRWFLFNESVRKRPKTKRRERCSLKIEALEERVDLLSLVREKYKPKKEGKTFVVNPCPVCGSKDHFTIYPETNSYCSFSKCCRGGSVYKYLQEVEHLSEEEAWNELNRRAGEAPGREFAWDAEIGGKEKSAQPQEPTKAEGLAPDQDYTALITQGYNNQTETDRGYFLNRGIPVELIEKYKLSVVDTLDGKRARLPIWSGGKVVGYTDRAIVEGQQPKYKNVAGAAHLFNIDTLHESHEVIVITEGIMDALSVEAAGYKAIALGGVQHADKLKKAIENTPAAANITFLTGFDNDEAGHKAAANWPSYETIKIPMHYKDLNEWRTKEPASFTDSIKNQIKTALDPRPDAVSTYLYTAFMDDIDKHKRYKDKKTGFINLDEEMKGVYPGLYVVGGISSVGKTTFVHQLADQFAGAGDHVLYFSLEQSKLEMVSKSLARITAKNDYSQAVSSISIRGGYTPPQVIKAVKDYQDTAKRVSVIEGNFSTNVVQIKGYITDYMRRNPGVKPIVMIDYLQIIPGEVKLGDKQRIDNTVTELKRISRDLDLIMFVISSLNRGNYLAPVDFESFKESGGIEYTADVIWGLQLAVINEPLFDKDSNVKAKRTKVKEAKAADPRLIELVCLKNRNGKPSFSCWFNYYPKFDLFVDQNELSWEGVTSKRL